MASYTTAEKLRIVRTSDDWLDVYTPFNRDFVEELKSSLPSQARKWDADLKAWSVKMIYGKEIIALIHKHFQANPAMDDSPWRAEQERQRRRDEEEKRRRRERERERERERTRPRQPTQTGDWAWQLYHALPLELRDKAYKAMLKVVHPDMGGSKELTQQLNAAFAAGDR